MKPWPFRDIILVLVALIVLSACNGTPDKAADGERSAGGSPSVGASTDVEVPGSCPNPHGGACRGLLDAGTYNTSVFGLGLTYTVPAGWANMEDLFGQVLLLPPGRDVDGVDAFTADYLSVNHGVTVAAADCSPKAMQGVGLDPAGIVRALGKRPGLQVTRPREASVAGLSGLIVDINLAPNTKAGCRVAGLGQIVPLIIGVGPAELEHAQVAGLRTRLYILQHGDSNVVVEVSDVAQDNRPFDYEAVIRSFRIRD